MKDIRTIICTLLTFAILPLLSGCNEEDDVIEIFVGKTWKLSFIAIDGSTKQYDFWDGNEAERVKSMTALGKDGNYTLDFIGSETNNTIGGTFTGKAILSRIEGKWRANGKDNTLKMDGIKIVGSENDLLAKAFITGMQNVVSYKGDINNLFIYYQLGQKTMFMGFKPVIKK